MICELSYGFHGHQACTWYTYIHMQTNNHSHKITNKQKSVYRMCVDVSEILKWPQTWDENVLSAPKKSQKTTKQVRFLRQEEDARSLFIPDV